MIVHAFDRRDERKRAIALEILGRPDYVISSQVLTEFYVTVTRKLAAPLTHAMASAVVATLSVGRVVPVDKDLVLAAVDLAAGGRLSIWDACIVRAALRARCSVLLTEDMNTGQDYGGVVTENPFT